MPQEPTDVVLTDDIKAKLKGFLGFQVEATFPYVPKVYREGDIPKELWPVFTLKSKDGLEIAAADDDAMGPMEVDGKSNVSRVSLRPGHQRLQTLRSGLKDIKGFLLENGERIDWNWKVRDLVVRKSDGSGATKNNVPIDKVIAYLPSALQVELQNAINERDVLTPEELRGLG